MYQKNYINRTAPLPLILLFQTRWLFNGKESVEYIYICAKRDRCVINGSKERILDDERVCIDQKDVIWHEIKI